MSASAVRGPGGGRDVPSALTAVRRRRELERLAEGWRPDLLVVGAGFTGAGIALDAALRGLSVAVVDRADLASGTSRWSSKLVHGGLRYLAGGDLALARESALERGVLMERVAPHLVRPLPFVTPLNAGMPPVSGALAGLGYLAGNALRLSAGTSGLTLPGPRLVGPRRARAMVPAIGRPALRGAWVNTDGQLVDDVRAVVAIARTAAAFGAAVLPHVAVTAVGADRADLVDARTGEGFEARAGRVVVAAGAWSDALDDRVVLRPSKGVHLVLDGAALGHPTAAVAAPVPGHLSRFVFALPQLDGRVYLGLTDDPVSGAVPDEAPVLDAERDFLLDAISRVLDRPLTPSDVVGGYAGYRPLVAGGEGAAPAATADLSRAHLVLDDPDGPITIVGGKLTTYRRMAADVVDRVSDRPCTTDRQPLVGALPRRRLPDVPARPWLVARYGGEAPDLEALIAADPWLAGPVVDGLPHLRVELAFAVRREGATSVADLLDRRTRIGLVASDRDAAVPIAEEVLARTPPLRTD
ncbi:glycerol-3-phosphate dehydrogenase/oxidase [Euzebya sp.]|uniref:glycerol-3-phosphate dehydrogenase/oxidase n=1 Tax=Euzebya sp. TaxID=1971409 RepID=UPI0035116CA1